MSFKGHFQSLIFDFYEKLVRHPVQSIQHTGHGACVPATIFAFALADCRIEEFGVHFK